MLQLLDAAIFLRELNHQVRDHLLEQLRIIREQTEVERKSGVRAHAS